MTWATVHSSHAIERVRFELSFSDPLPKKVVESSKRRFVAQSAQLRFGPVQEQLMHRIVIGPTPDVPSPEPSVGWQSQRLKGPSKIAAEAVVLNPESFVYESTEYRDWRTAKTRFISVCGELIRSLLDVVDLSSFSHDYTDRFVYKGDVNAAKPLEILDAAIAPLLSQDALDGSELWHLHRGWFEKRQNTKYLINQNLDCQEGRDLKNNEAVKSLQIYTKAEMRTGLERVADIGLENIASELHVICNMYFAKILCEDGRKMVRIEETGAGSV